MRSLVLRVKNFPNLLLRYELCRLKSTKFEKSSVNEAQPLNPSPKRPGLIFIFLRMEKFVFQDRQDKKYKRPMIEYEKLLQILKLENAMKVK